MAAPKEVTLEVHVEQNGKWSMHSRYPFDREMAAVQEAKALDRTPAITSVKVIKEEYDPKTNSSIDVVVYASGHDAGPANKPQARTAKKGGAKKTRAKTEAASPVPPPELASAPIASEKSNLGIIAKLVMITIISIVIAGMVSGFAYVWLQDSTWGTQARTNTLFGAFVGTFLISAICMVVSYLSGEEFQSAAQIKSKALHNRAKAALGDGGPEPVSETRTEPGAAPSQADRNEEPETKPEPLSEEAAILKAQLLAFMDDSLGKNGAGRKDLDRFNKLGINLYLAGACEPGTQRPGMNATAITRVLAECIEEFGFRPADARSFADKYSEYLLADPSYMDMFQAGRNAFSTYQSDTSVAAEYMKKALEEWNKPKARQAQRGTVTVLFTDIAGSTAMTQTLGDAGAQKVVHAHNRIVRNCLIRFEGQEVKHTGDGIMASFSNTTKGVQAAAAMQEQVAQHNVTEPGLPLQIKIGINAGEPISEDNDLFGTTVQLAARIVDKAKAGQIFVSETVRGFCAGKILHFVNHGNFEMKGFEGGQNLYELIWDGSEPLAAAEEAVETPAAEPEIPGTPGEEADVEEAAAAADEAPEEEAAAEAASGGAAPEDTEAQISDLEETQEDELAAEPSAEADAAAPPPPAPEAQPDAGPAQAAPEVPGEPPAAAPPAQNGGAKAPPPAPKAAAAKPAVAATPQPAPGATPSREKADAISPTDS